MAIPGGAIYGFRRNDALNAFNNAKLQIGKRRQNIMSEYGYTGDFDASGNMTNMRIDPTSQYGRFQRMMKGHDTQLSGLQDQQIERGLGAGQAGLGAQGESEARYQQGGEQTEMGRALSGGLSDLSEAGMEAERTYNKTIAETDAEEARQAWEDERFTKAQETEETGATPDEPADLIDLLHGISPQSMRPRPKAKGRKAPPKPKPKAPPKPKKKPKGR